MQSVVHRRFTVGVLGTLVSLALQAMPAAASSIDHENPYLWGNYGVHS
jgi:hypothetical protein